MTAAASILPSTARVLVMTRIFDAPRALVFKAWTDPSLLKNWWGPKNYPAVKLEMDVRPGGRWRGCLRSTETGKELWHRGVFREVVEPERIAFTFAWEEEGDRGLETLVTITFADADGKTRMTLRHEPFQSTEERDGHRRAWASAFDRLGEHLTHPDGSYQ